MNIIKIAERISYIRATENPLSADVGIIEGDSRYWIFDVGANGFVPTEINVLPKPKNIIISHFHPDHMGNLDKIKFENLYLGANTYKYVKQGTAVENEMTFEDGMTVKIFPVPSSHAKGSVGMLVGEYAFLGDATYAAVKQGKTCYNSSVLKEEIDTLSALPAKYFLLSHSEDFIKTKEEVLTRLKEIYSRRNPKGSYIFL